jgi:four helix bundle protein
MSYKIVIENNRIAVEEERGKYKINLNERFLQFAVDVIEYSFSLPKLREFDSIKYQLSKSATSIGANYTESQAGSFAEFKQRIQICLREARETYYWLKIIQRLDVENNKENKMNLDQLLKEANEIQLILGAISSKIKNKTKP